MTQLLERIADLFNQDESVSDVHLTANERLWVRRNGQLEVSAGPLVEDGDLRSLLDRLGQIKKPDELIDRHDGGYDFAAQVGPTGVRCNLYRTGGMLGLALRRHRRLVPTLAELGLPETVLRQTERSKGIMLVTGSTGSGKSTTLAACLQHINRTRACHILTIEDPIEFRLRSDKAKITARQVGSDVPGFEEALRAAMREDPDVIMIGEIRDAPTMRAALAAADTGHLVLASMHTINTYQTVQRATSFFPAEAKDWARSVFANVLNCVVSQTLVPKMDGSGRVLAYEVLRSTAAVRQLIAEDKIKQIENVIRQGKADGQVLMNNCLAGLVGGKVICRSEALRAAYDPSALEKDLT